MDGPRDKRKQIAAAGAVCVLVLLAIGLFRWHTHWRTVAPPDGTLTIATWNLRHFDDETPGDLVDAAAFVLNENAADLVAIQEVRGEGEAVRKLANRLGRAWRVKLGPITGNYERLAFIYDSRVVRPVREVRMPNLDAIDRRPLATQFRSGGFDFTLINVHLLASDAERRRAEAMQLVGRLRQDRWPPGERDLIVLGDLNTQRMRGPTMASFRQAGWTPATSAPTNASGTRSLDHVLLPAGVNKSRGWVGEAVESISDHAPVFVEIDIDSS